MFLEKIKRDAMRVYVASVNNSHTQRLTGQDLCVACIHKRTYNANSSEHIIVAQNMISCNYTNQN